MGRLKYVLGKYPGVGWCHTDSHYNSSSQTGVWEIKLNHDLTTVSSDGL